MKTINKLSLGMGAVFLVGTPLTGQYVQSGVTDAWSWVFKNLNIPITVVVGLYFYTVIAIKVYRMNQLDKKVKIPKKSKPRAVKSSQYLA